MLPLRLRRVGGHDGRANDVLFHPPARPPPASAPPHPQAVVFFGGDVQDYPEVMQAHRDNRHYVKWNLESTARMLAHDFPTQFILVVKPARLLQSVSNRIKSLPTAELLEAVSTVTLPEDIDIEELHNASIHRSGESRSNGSSSQAHASAAHKPDSDPLWWRDKLALDECSLTLVGFSKGCVVLNQLIYEFHYTKTLTPGDAHMMRFMSRVADMYWLDGGHAGGKNTWITSRSLLETLTRLEVNMFVHVSPYQVQDEGRPWIGREEKAFTGLLNKLGAKVHRYLHSQSDAPHSLHMHFDVLANFKRVQDSTPHSMPDSSDEEP
ncbi:UPF0565 protein C2orf69 isoform X2 [Pararge aegeria]|uniref:UPF0565 protein C2orf69 isoform X2 n=1 Tax=Pararge aegeria TaxID=116150 RepID=UPI0019CF961A|nr:UPF0565 protein C2orf69 isoform X2 [Pararge aegeria]